MGLAPFDQQIKHLRSRAARYRAIGGLLGDVAISTKLTQLAAGLDDAVERLMGACAAVGMNEKEAHRVWAGLNIGFLTATLHAQNALDPSGQRAEADRLQQLSSLCLEEAKSTGHNADQKALAGWAFGIAQLAEDVARRAKERNAP
jgi:hypothetical protein